VTHDTVCPWCRIGCHNLHAALDTLGPRGVEVVYRPYLLEPDLPPQGADLRERLGKKYGAERVASMFADVTRAGAKYGVRFDFDRVRVQPQTAPSHALIAWAPAAQRRALVTAIHLAYFEQGEDIGAPAVLAALARGVGLDADAALGAVRDAARLGAVRQQASSAQAGGMRGVPHFVIGARELHGAQSPEALREAMLSA
jgi:predicted DsbA family dithiol-disulfide isomerase